MTCNFRDLIGLPFIDGGRDPSIGLDCWGLIMEVTRRMGIELPDYHIQCFDAESIISQVKKDRNKWTKVTAPSKGCIVGMARSVEFPDSINHFGVCINSNTFLHSVEKAGVVSTRVNNSLFKKSIKGYYICSNR